MPEPNPANDAVDPPALCALSQAAGRLQDRVVAPPFEVLARRAARRRRMQALAATAAVAAVAVGIGTGLTLSSPSADAPTGPADTGPSPTRPSDPTSMPQEQRARAILSSDDASAYDYSVDNQGQVLALFEVFTGCTRQHLCGPAYALKGSDGLRAGMLGKAHRLDALYPLSKGFLGLGRIDDPSTYGTETDGHTTVSHDALPTQPGDVAVSHHNAQWVYREPRNLLFPAAVPDKLDYSGAGTVTGAGRLVTLGATRTGPEQKPTFHVSLLIQQPGTVWREIPLDQAPNATAGSVHASGGTVVAYSTYDGATVSPVGTLAVSRDGGDTVATATRADTPFSDIESLAVGADGTVLFSNESGALWRLDPAGDPADPSSYTRLSPPDGVRQLHASGDTFYCLGPGADGAASLLVSTDHGGSWAVRELPGRS